MGRGKQNFLKKTEAVDEENNCQMKKKCVKEALQIKNQHPRVISLFHIPPLDNIIHKKSHNMPCGQKKIVQTTNKLPRVSTIKMTKIKLTSQQ